MTQQIDKRPALFFCPHRMMQQILSHALNSSQHVPIITAHAPSHVLTFLLEMENQLGSVVNWID